MKKIRVSADSGTYEILVDWGCTSRIGELAAGALDSRKCVLFTDENVWARHGDHVEASLREADFEVTVVVRPPGEAQKSLDVVSEIYDILVEARVDRRSALIALGGGVVGDLGGFIAATYLRGIPYVQVPTTLLAQVDSSVGGKVAVNHPRAKNLIGAFYQPAAVFIDPSLLQSLPREDFTAGMAEVIKYGVIRAREFFDFLKTNRPEIQGLEDRSALEHIIAVSCQIKADVVSRDEKEEGLRAILNYGHTIGHAIEAGVEGYGHFRHGEVVSLGMIAAATISEHLGLADAGLLADHIEILSDYGLPTECNIANPDEILGRMYLDKKVQSGRLRFVLARSIGEVELSDDVSDGLVRQVMRELGADS